MGENGIPSPLSKKRVASEQLSKDSDQSFDNESQGSGSFQKASEEILATRQIVNVHRSNAVDVNADDEKTLFISPSHVEDVGGRNDANVEDLDGGGDVEDLGEKTNVNVEDLGVEDLDKITDANVDNLGEANDANVEVHSNEQPEDICPSEASNINVKLHSKDQGAQADANVDTTCDEQHQDKGLVEPSNIVQCHVQDERQSEGEECENSQTGSKDAYRQHDSISDDKYSGSSKVDNRTKHIDGTDANQFEMTLSSPVVSANNISSIAIPPPGAIFSSSTFSFGTAPLSFATPTGFASFRSSSQIFGSTGNATAGTNPGSVFSFKFPDESTIENNGTSGFQPSGSQTSKSLSNLPAPSSGSFKLQEVSLLTGEEQETAIFSSGASLFEFVSNAWKERGKGELKINVSQGSTSKARLLMRMKGNYKLLLNANLYPDMKVTNMESRGVTFACINSAAEGREGLTTYALKFRDSMVATSFQDIVNLHKGGSSLGLKTPENSP